MTPDISPVRTNGELSDFVNFPFFLYKNSPLWIPPIKKQERELLSPQSHPFWLTARRELFLARQNGKVIGRIAAIIDDKYNEYSGEACGSFGFFECVSDQEAANALLNSASAWLGEHGMNFMRGPLNPSANYSCGVLAGGFEYPPALMMSWNPPIYPQLLEQWGMYKEQDLFAYVIDKKSLSLPPWLLREVARLKKESGFTFRASSKATLADDIRAMLDIYQKAWAENWGFSPLSKKEAERHVKELKQILDPAFFVLFFHDKTPVAGMVALPDISPLLRRLGGSIGLGAPWHFWRSRKEIRKGLRVMLFGILPQYRLYGLPLLLLDYMLEQARAREDLEWVEGSWILESNPAMDNLLEDFSGKLLKRYRIYRKDLPQC